MVKRVHVVGDASSLYWERSSQDGDDTPPAYRRPGLWPVNRYALERESMLRNQFDIYNRFGSKIGGPWYMDDFYYASLGQPIWPSEVSVLDKLGEKWRNTDLNIGMYLSPEGRESVSMMVTGLKKFTNAAIALRRGNFGEFSRNLNELPRASRKMSARKFNQGDISGAFLAAHLGWEPLIKDVYTASQGIEDISEKTYRISARKAGNFKISGTPPVGVENQLSHDVYVRLTLDVKRPPTFAQRFGMENPFLIAWELVPLSFVADYFLPIGNVINAMGTISGLWASKGFRNEKASYHLRTQAPPGALVFDIGNGYPYSNREWAYSLRSGVTFNRTTYTPSFQDPFRNLRVTLPSSVMKLGTLSALAHQSVLALNKR